MWQNEMERMGEGYLVVVWESKITKYYVKCGKRWKQNEKKKTTTTRK